MLNASKNKITVKQLSFESKEAELEWLRQQARIEEALEKVRARTMAMSDSTELSATASILFQQILLLGPKPIACAFIIADKETQTGEIYISADGTVIPRSFTMPYHGEPAQDQIFQSWVKGEDFTILDLEGDALMNHLGFIAKNMPVMEMLDSGDVPPPTRLALHIIHFKYGFLGINYLKPNEEMIPILHRFAKVFDQTYTRFLDLQKAETQAREAQIEVALERVRSRTMAMYRSDELRDVITNLFVGLDSLGFNAEVCNLSFIDAKSKNSKIWTAHRTSVGIASYFVQVPYFQHPFTDRLLASWQDGDSISVHTLEGDLKKSYDLIFFEKVDFSDAPESVKELNASLPNQNHPITISAAAMKYGLLMVSKEQPLLDDDAVILHRFAVVFEQTYTRFLDLQKAEAQAKEAQIEAALERVRSRTMGMKKSEELAETSMILFEQVTALGIKPRSCGFLVMNEESKLMDDWSSNLDQDGKGAIVIGKISFDQHPMISQVVAAWRRGDPYFIGEIHGPELQEYYEAVTAKEAITKEIKDKVLAVKQSEYTNSFYFEFGMLYVLTDTSLKEAEIDIILRFASILKLTYRRFLDLQKAETQAREAKIEAALERVRSASMAMHKSAELSNVASVLFSQIKQLEVPGSGCGIIILDDGPIGHMYYSISGEILPEMFPMPVHEDEELRVVYEAWKDKKQYYVHHIFGEAKIRHEQNLERMFRLSGNKRFLNINEEYEKIGLSHDEIFAHHAYFNSGCILLMKDSKIEQKDILIRIAKVFEQTYTRFLDLQKAEAQAREAQIEAALERVRAASMAMHRTEELQKVIFVVDDELKSLDILMDGSFIEIFDESTDPDQTKIHGIKIWMANPTHQNSQLIHIPYFKSSILDSVIDARKNKINFISDYYTKRVKNNFYRKVYVHSDLKGMPKYQQDQVLKRKGFARSIALTQYAAITMFNWEGQSYTSEENKILERIAKVFDQTYTRFLDIKKAEAQAREAEIQLALERVRARTMAMHHSSELGETSYLLFEQLKALGKTSDQTSIAIYSKDGQYMDVYITLASSQWKKPVRVKVNDSEVLEEVQHAWKKKDKSIIIDLSGEKLKEFNKLRSSVSKAPVMSNEQRWILHAAFFSQGALIFSTANPQADETIQLLERFAQVFNQTYTRFLDLENAEAQAREADIQLALERVRAKSLAMHNSNEVGESAEMMYEELKRLGLDSARFGIAILYKDKMLDVWNIRKVAKSKPLLVIGQLHVDIHPFIKLIFEAWRNKQSSFVNEVKKSELKSYYTAINNYPGYPIRVEMDNIPERQFGSNFFFDNGFLYAFTDDPIAPEKAAIMQRFANSFGQIYRRYQDLIKFERQAREAQIEAALERVRSKTMAMHSSADVDITVITLFEELVKLGLDKSIRSGIAIMNQSKIAEVWAGSTNPSTGNIFLDKGILDTGLHPMLVGIQEAWEAKKPTYTYFLEGDDLIRYFKAINDAPDYSLKVDFEKLPEKIIHYDFLFPDGFLFAFSPVSFSDESEKLFSRFAAVFAQTYRRFLDLQKAEAQAREAEIQLSLERVRAASMAMHNSNELLQVALTFMDQVETLRIPSLGVALNIIDLESGTGITYFADNTIGKEKRELSKTKEIKLDSFWIGKEIVDQVKAGAMELNFVAEGNKIDQWIDFIDEIWSEQRAQRLRSAKFDKVHFHYFCFHKASGILFSATQAFSEEYKKVIQRLINTFAMSYTRFLDLQKAEALTREAQIEASLERVRAKTMAMHNSEDVGQCILKLFGELTKLGVHESTRLGIGIFNHDNENMELWTAAQDENAIVKLYSGNIDMSAHPLLQSARNSWKEKQIVNQFILESQKEIIEYIQIINAFPDYPVNLKIESQPEKLIHYDFVFNQGIIYAFCTSPLPQELEEVFCRFSLLFEQTYRRYLDLVNAEERTKEAQIEAALERVRAQTMAMHNSEDVGKCIIKMFGELTALGVDEGTRFGIGILNHDSDNIQLWTTSKEKEEFKMHIGNLDMSLHPLLKSARQAWKAQVPLHLYILEGDDLLEYYQALNSAPDYPLQISMQKLPERQFHYGFVFEHGFFYAFCLQELTPELIQITQRFSSQFAQTYRRFLDLVKAEAQAREAQIEAALERVRSRSMAMHLSSELADVAFVVFEQIKKLGFEIFQSWIDFVHEPEDFLEMFLTDFDGKYNPNQVKFSLSVSPMDEFLKVWKSGVPFVKYGYKGTEVKNWFDLIYSITGDPMFILEKYPYSIYYLGAANKHGTVSIASLDPINPEIKPILSRFAKVFEQTYTRFLDLQKAEAQAREAQIEAALEKIRAKANGMRHSNELSELVDLVFAELSNLEITLHQCIVWTINPKDLSSKVFFVSPPDLPKILPASLPYHEYKPYLEYIKGYQTKEQNWTYTLQGEDKVNWDTYLFNETEFAQFPRPFIEALMAPDSITFKGSFNDFGILTAIVYDDITSAQQSILNRFGQVFNQSYIRFVDLQKAEAQAKEAQIEAALERVRSRTMGMQSSSELSEVASLLFEQMTVLDLRPNACALGIFNEENGTHEMYFSVNGKVYPESLSIPYALNPNLKSIYEAWKEGKELQFHDLEGEALRLLNESVDNYLKSTGVILPSESNVDKTARRLDYHAFFSQGLLLFAYNEPVEETDIFIRFAKVFEQTYTRFQDLKKAEAQAREAKIEASLERVRSRSLAMHKTDELQEVVRVVAEELKNTGVILDTWGAVICTYFQDSNDVLHWTAAENPDNPSIAFLLPYFKDELYDEAWESKNKGDNYFAKVFSFEVKNAFFNHAFVHSDYRHLPEDYKKTILESKNHGIAWAWAKNSAIMIPSIQGDLPSDDEKAILIRFAKVFEQSFIRFLDLKKAEAQTREAQIEAALERVRSRTLAMHKSEELAEATNNFYLQLATLGIKPYRCNIAFVNKDDQTAEIWSTTNEGKVIPKSSSFPLNGHKYIKSMYTTWKNQSQSILRIEGQNRIEWTRYIMKYVNFEEYQESNVDLKALEKEPAIFTVLSFRHGFFFIHTKHELENDDQKIIARFVKVFEQTYIRFFDLQKAESQAREAQIEAAMERIRSRSLAMRSSEEIMEVITEIRRQIDSLGQLDLEASVVHLYPENSNMFESIAAVRPPGESGEIVLANVKFPVNAMQRVKEMIQMYHSDIQEYTLEFDKEMAEQWQQIMVKYAPMIAERRIGFVENRRISDHSEFWNFADFSEGSLLLVTHSPASEDTKTVLRKASQVFDLAYRRFRDLQKAESRAKDAIKQASLDRVRGEIASMRSTADLDRITPLIWNELIVLGVPFIRCGVNIIHEGIQNIEMYLSNPEGLSLAKMNLSFDSSDLTQNAVNYWKKNKVYHQHWSSEEYINWTKSLLKSGHITDINSYQGSSTPPKSLDLYFIPFDQGSLYVGSQTQLSQDEVELVKSLAEAFSIAYARYEDFVKLEKAKESIETTLLELKSTQSQLIHSEKMASLGELTAGIAHEIQNPLNFVNNFSEVSAELMDEMNVELENGEIEEVKFLAIDIKQNLEKINHHGQRASAIVKSMLQHSRTSSGQKEPTNINLLCDEYLRLAYHGFRAKDNSFQSAFDFEFDDSLPKISVIPQDIGRVLLNLLNNAFQAVDERLKKNEKAYKPKVTIKTKQLDSKVEISVNDNGNGIPDSIKAKIFQPFFTTKPTGQGTGLGLSLSYDIVKAHGGEIIIESSSAIGTTFKILLPK